MSGPAQGSGSGSQHVRAITLVRHGRTAYNASGRLQGQIDIPLDPVGRWQARQTSEALRQLYVQSPASAHQIVISSDLSRANDTAHSFADPLGVPVHTDPRVRERNFGRWEGLSVTDLARDHPEDYRSWAEFRGGELNYGAEPKTEVGRRGVAALTDWGAQGGLDTELFVFSHGAWISQTLQTLLGLSSIAPDFADLVSMRNAHWARLIPIQLGDAPLRWRLVDYNHGPALADTDQWEHPGL